MLYTPPAFRETDLARLHEHIAATGFATLITVGANGPLVSHAPLILDRDTGPNGTLTGHLARANPQWRESDLSKAAVAVFMGPDAYVSPGWYATKREHGKVVPTWNYTTVHARGRLSLVEDPDWLLAHVTALTDRHEARFGEPWKVTDAPADFIDGMRKGIVGFRLAVETLEGKAKLSQNRPEEDRRGVVAGLGTSTSPADRAVAARMRERER